MPMMLEEHQLKNGDKNWLGIVLMRVRDTINE